MQQLQQWIATLPVSPNVFNCATCEDVGMQRVDVVDVKTDKKWRATTICVCRQSKKKETMLSKIPPRYRDAELMTLTPYNDRHTKQGVVINELKENPFNSYLITGKNNAGKTHFGWALWRHASESGRRAIAITLAELLAEYRRMESSVGEGEFRADWKPSVVPEDLKQTHTPYTIFIDEVEKVRVTPFTVEKLFELIKAAHEYGHQLIVVSNMDYISLEGHFSKQDEVWGASIIRRLKEGTTGIEMF